MVVFGEVGLEGFANCVAWVCGHGVWVVGGYCDEAYFILSKFL